MDILLIVRPHSRRSMDSRCPSQNPVTIISPVKFMTWEFLVCGESELLYWQESAVQYQRALERDPSFISSYMLVKRVHSICSEEPQDAADIWLVACKQVLAPACVLTSSIDDLRSWFVVSLNYFPGRIQSCFQDQRD